MFREDGKFVPKMVNLLSKTPSWTHEGVEISQQMKYFLAPQEERLIVIGIRRVVESSTSNDKDSHQNVSIMVYKNHIPKILNALSLVCD